MTTRADDETVVVVEYGGRRLTLPEYLSGDETNRPFELAYGVVREPVSPTWQHQLVVGRVYQRLERHVSRYGLGRVAQSPIDVVLDRDRALVVQPDVVFVATERLSICKARIWGPPDLVVEVLSMGTARHDRTVKIRFTTSSDRRMAVTSVYGPKYRAPSPSTRRVTNTRGYGSCTVTLMYGYVLSSRSITL